MFHSKRVVVKSIIQSIKVAMEKRAIRVTKAIIIMKRAKKGIIPKKITKNTMQKREATKKNIIMKTDIMLQRITEKKDIKILRWDNQETLKKLLLHILILRRTGEPWSVSIPWKWEIIKITFWHFNVICKKILLANANRVV